MAENGLASLFAKIALVSGEVGAVVKDKKHGQGYNYFSSDAIMGALNVHMANHGLVVIPTTLDAQQIDGRWVINYQFVLCDAETGATFSANWTGESLLQIGQNKDDKAMGKAHTYALKYWLIQLFKISTVDTDDLDDDDNNQKSKNEQTPNPQSSNTPQDWEKNLITLVTPLFKARDHAKNAINGLLQNKIIVKGQPLNEAAAAVFQNRALKEFEADEEMLQLILGKQPKDFKQSPEAFKAAWELLAKASKQVDE